MAILDASEARRKRKEEGREKKRQKIQESGGVRPRIDTVSKKDKKVSSSTSTTTSSPKDIQIGSVGSGKAHHETSPSKNQRVSSDMKTTKSSSFLSSSSSRQQQQQFQNQSYQQNHRFGRVMAKTPCRNKPRYSTISIALPGSVLSNCQTKELRTLLVGQIARAATIYHVDEIIVFDDKLSSNNKSSWRKQRNHHHHQKDQQRKHHKTKEDDDDDDNTKGDEREEENHRPMIPKSNPQEFMARILQYCECPQYLRRKFFPMHPDLQYTGLLAPVDAPHHVRADDHSRFREGIVIDKTKTQDDGQTLSLVNCGIRNRPVAIDRKLTPGIRCTVEIEPSAYTKVGPIHGKVVSPSVPRERNGTYWGYQTRIANSIHDVFDNCPFSPGGKYDLKIGTSERGDVSIEDSSSKTKFTIPKYEHVLIVFGGVAGIEECVDADESIKLPGSQSKQLFDMWLNTCPFQGSRTIRTEEAVLISLATISPALAKSALSSNKEKVVLSRQKMTAADIEFSDESPSDESSDDDDDDDDDNNNKNDDGSGSGSEDDDTSGSSEDDSSGSDSDE